MSGELSPGDRAPDFDLTAADGSQLSLGDLEGTKAILYFYPEAMTPGCRTQAIDFQTADDDLRTAGYAVVGVSPDKPESLARFADQEGLSFPLLSDPDRSTLRAYGAYGEKQNYGKTITGVIAPQWCWMPTAPSSTPSTTSRPPAMLPNSAATSAWTDRSARPLAPVAGPGPHQPDVAGSPLNGPTTSSVIHPP